jgi:hypothetical protein
VETDKESEKYARECVRLARLADDPELRDQLLQLARDWMAEAMREERLRAGASARKIAPPHARPPRTTKIMLQQ